MISAKSREAQKCRQMSSSFRALIYSRQLISVRVGPLRWEIKFPAGRRRPLSVNSLIKLTIANRKKAAVRKISLSAFPRIRALVSPQRSGSLDKNGPILIEEQLRTLKTSVVLSSIADEPQLLNGWS